MQFWRSAITPRGLSLQRTNKPYRPQLETLEDRVTPTTLSSILAAPTLITDNNAPGTFTLQLNFSGPMNTNITPAISFPTSGEDPGASLIYNAQASGFTSATTFRAVFGSTDQNVNLPNIDVRVSGAFDAVNSSVAALTLNDIFSINTTNPIVTQLNVSTAQITSANLGNTFQIAVTYREQMDTTVNPTIAFNNSSVLNTLTFQSGAWNGNGTVYTATYHVGGSANVVPSVNVTISGAKNVGGFVQLSYTANSVFTINTGTGSTSTAGFPVGSFMRLAGDFNGDGLTDVAAYYASNGKWLVSLSTGSGFLAPIQWFKFSSGVTLKTMMVGDFNNDGKDDIGYFYNQNGAATLHVALSTGSAFTPTRWVNEGFFGVTGWTRFLVGDFNNDGKDDIAAFQNDSAVARWIVNISDGTKFTATKWADLRTISVGGWTNAVVGDFDNDGKSDIANFYNKNGIARWYVSLASSGVSFATTNFGNMPNAGVWTNQMVGDFTGDGKDDIVAYNSTTHEWWVSATNPTPTSFNTNLWLTSTFSRTLVQRVADFNHDGKDDMSLLDLNTGQLFVAQSSGSGFGVTTWDILPRTSLSLLNEFVGDFNGDGKPDLAHFLGNASTTQWWVSINNGTHFSTTRWR